MHKLSVVIITKNEEKHIADALLSAVFADEVVVLDSGSKDTTCKIAEKTGAKVYQEEWRGFGAQKNRAVELASNDWVFVLDADERITSELQYEIEQILKSPDAEGYFIPRINYFWGKAIKTCGLYPDYTIRLFNRSKGRFTEVAVHEAVQIGGKVGYIKSPMIHLAYENISQFIEKQNRYSTLHAKGVNRLKALFNPSWTFFRLFVLKRGFLDGWDGFIISRLYAQYTFWKYVK